ncbi:hypothetical protein ABT354_35265 [Streptomyces sp. NPDC000594]|uniref:hypothetical protein n=1 Tax=Streptomyces sp. NPDC000594 TaxID=3154261 RepID=UPI003325C84F
MTGPPMTAPPGKPSVGEPSAGKPSAGKSSAGEFASRSVPVHLARGAVGFGALAGSVALLPAVGPVSLLLAPLGLLVLRGCPMCWAIGLAQTVSRGRLRRSCTEDGCRITTAPPAAPADR